MSWCLFVAVVSSCINQKSEDESSFKAYPKVRSTGVTYGVIRDYVEMNATSSYLKTSVISSPIDGYILHTYVEPGQIAEAGQVLYTIQTRESRALKSQDTEAPDSFDFTGTDTIRSRSEGYIAESFHQEGDFVTPGERLLTLKETSSLVFVLDLPYEWNTLVSQGMKVNLLFPDESSGTGIISLVSPEVDPVNQTQKVIISVKNPGRYPEGLIARVRIPKSTSSQATLLPKDAILTNETETEYWVMKMINDSMAVKIPVIIGIRSHDTIEVVKPDFYKTDRILIYGNYAVPDTLQVTLTDSSQ